MADDFGRLTDSNGNTIDEHESWKRQMPNPQSSKLVERLGDVLDIVAAAHEQFAYSKEHDAYYDDRYRAVSEGIAAIQSLQARIDVPVERQEVLDFLGHAFRNVDGMPPLSNDDVADIAGALTAFRKPAIQSLQAPLATYGRHKESCNLSTIVGPMKCTCGFDAALRAQAALQDKE